ncbi:GNAT family N-acetyltransferase [Aquimarina celericrescens]|uniref:GNAT family N-acetyltransferase n=1 Tax=Aquimarina celericrescens TaxID=1964542 RepID=A0ABW5B292_9FLAO|nr:GNAT family N-acetyltransferase [Aquimarina celericrescens]
MTIENSTATDIFKILELYDHAISYQSKMGAVQWPKFTKEDIKKEVDAAQQWKIVIDDQIACVWMTTFNDPYIWEHKNRDPSVYIHRIATHPTFRGQHFVKHIIDWALTFAKKQQKSFIRMDTAGHNEKLISYYTCCGFTFLGSEPLNDTANLPDHYHNTPVCLFEMEV